MAKKPGFMLYFEDYASLRETLSADELISVLDAMSSYSESGALPDETALSEAARICWRFIRPKLDRDARLYAEKVEKRRHAANARWSNDANACTCIENMQNVQVQEFMPTHPIPSQLTPAVKSKPRPRFVPPTLEEVREYCESRESPVDPERFVSYYESVGWRVGKQPMKSWKAAIGTWERREAQETPPQSEKVSHYAKYESN